MNFKIIREGIDLIKQDDLIGLQNMYSYYFSQSDDPEEYKPNINAPYIFRNLLSNAFLYQKKDILVWLWEIYQELDPTSKIGLKPTWQYGKSLIFKKNKDIYNWACGLEFVF